MGASTAVVVIFTVIAVVALAGLVIWCTTQSHIHCVAEINKAWEASARFRDMAWARVIDERKINAQDRATLEQWLVALADQVSRQSEQSQKLTTAVVTLWEKGKISTIG